MIKYPEANAIRVSNLKDLMKSRGLNQADVARLSRKKHSHISGILTGGKAIGSKVAGDLELALGVADGYLDTPREKAVDIAISDDDMDLRLLDELAQVVKRYEDELSVDQVRRAVSYFCERFN